MRSIALFRILVFGVCTVSLPPRCQYPVPLRAKLHFKETAEERDGTEISPMPPLQEKIGLTYERSPYLKVNVYVCFVSPSGPVTSIVAAAWVETVTGQRLDAGLPFTVIPLIRLDMATGVNVTWLPPAFTS